MLNKVTLIGNAGSDPEIRTMQSGDRVANISLATSERWKDKSTGEKKEKTEWHRVVIFSKALVDLAENYIRKGSKLYIEGQIETRQWDKDGEKRYSTEIVLRPYKSEIVLLSERATSDPTKADHQPQDLKNAAGFAEQAPLDDSEVPF